jgi:hypothetical protein
VPAAHRLSLAAARRAAIRAQLLDAQRPTDLLDTVAHLTLLQIDPTAAIAPAADLVAWTRLGSGYEATQLQQALGERKLFELDALVRPMADVGLASMGGRPRLAARQRLLQARHPRPTEGLGAPGVP